MTILNHFTACLILLAAGGLHAKATNVTSLHHSAAAEYSCYIGGSYERLRLDVEDVEVSAKDRDPNDFSLTIKIKYNYVLRIDGGPELRSGSQIDEFEAFVSDDFDINGKYQVIEYFEVDGDREISVYLTNSMHLGEQHLQGDVGIRIGGYCDSGWLGPGVEMEDILFYGEFLGDVTEPPSGVPTKCTGWSIDGEYPDFIKVALPPMVRTNFFAYKTTWDPQKDQFKVVCRPTLYKPIVDPISNIGLYASWPAEAFPHPVIESNTTYLLSDLRLGDAFVTAIRGGGCKTYVVGGGREEQHCAPYHLDLNFQDKGDSQHSVAVGTVDIQLNIGYEEVNRQPFNLISAGSTGSSLSFSDGRSTHLIGNYKNDLRDIEALRWLNSSLENLWTGVTVGPKPGTCEFPCHEIRYVNARPDGKVDDNELQDVLHRLSQLPPVELHLLLEGHKPLRHYTPICNQTPTVKIAPGSAYFPTISNGVMTVREGESFLFRLEPDLPICPAHSFIQLEVVEPDFYSDVSVNSGRIYFDPYSDGRLLHCLIWDDLFVEGTEDVELIFSRGDFLNINTSITLRIIDDDFSFCSLGEVITNNSIDVDTYTGSGSLIVDAPTACKWKVLNPWKNIRILDSGPFVGPAEINVKVAPGGGTLLPIQVNDIEIWVRQEPFPAIEAPVQFFPSTWHSDSVEIQLPAPEPNVLFTVFRNTQQDLSGAVYVGESNTTFHDQVPEPGRRYYYWVQRSVNGVAQEINQDARPGWSVNDIQAPSESDAVLIAPGELISGEMNGMESDWYRINLPTAGRLEVSGRASPNLAIRMRLEDGRHNAVEPLRSPSSYEFHRTSLLNPATVFIEVRPDQTAHLETYTLEVNFAPLPAPQVVSIHPQLAPPRITGMGVPELTTSIWKRSFNGVISEIKPAHPNVNMLIDEELPNLQAESDLMQWYWFRSRFSNEQESF